MAPKKKRSQQTKTAKKDSAMSPYFGGLTPSQTRSLAVGSILVGLFLFFLAAFTWENKERLQLATIFPTSGVTAPTLTPGSATPTLTQMISATSTARLDAKQPLVKKLPNTTSKVTYTVEQDDTIADIGVALCHSDTAWVSIVETNGMVYPYTIHPGETYIITCN